MTASTTRASVTLSLRKDLADRLDQEADDRVVGKGVLVEKALEAYLPTLPALTAAVPTSPAPDMED